ncbi:N/A [soil metagenome]
MLIPDNRDEFRNFAGDEPKFGPAPAALLEGLAQLSECEIHVISCSHRQLASPPKLAENIWYHSVVVSRWGWRLGYFGCVARVRRKLQEICPDIVHGQGTERYCALGAALSGFPNLITIHGNMRAVRRALGAPLWSHNGLAACLEAITLPLTAGVICPSNYTQRQVGRLARRTWVVPNAVDSKFFEVVRRLDSTDVLLCAANAALYKNQDRLITALDETARNRPFSLVLAGSISPENPYGAKVLDLCADRQWCHHAGSLTAEELRTELARATALVLPSLEDNCPMVILEAMAAGVPVAASNIGGIPDLVEPGVTGVLFDPRDEQSMREGVAKILQNPDSAVQMGKAAYEQAERRFRPVEVAKRHLDIYRELLAQPIPEAAAC